MTAERDAQVEQIVALRSQVRPCPAARGRQGGSRAPSGGCKAQGWKPQFLLGALGCGRKVAALLRRRSAGRTVLQLLPTCSCCHFRPAGACCCATDACPCCPAPQITDFADRMRAAEIEKAGLEADIQVDGLC